jgi:hypothetical protein
MDLLVEGRYQTTQNHQEQPQSRIHPLQMGILQIVYDVPRGRLSIMTEREWDRMHPG